MPEMLIVLGDRRHISTAQAVIEGTHVRWTGGWTSPWPENMSPGQNPQGAGEWLKTQWAAAGLNARSVWVVMSREDIVLRHLELPSAPDEELADLVKFQAAARSSVPLDQTALDFLPLPVTSSRPGRDVLSATVANSVLDGYRAVLKAADRELAGVTFSSTALAEWTLRYSRRREAEGTRSEVSRSGAHALMATLTRRTADPGHAELTIVRDGPKVELVVVAERQLVFGHAARISAVAEDECQVSLQAEISRTLVAAERLRPDLKLQHAWLVGGAAAQVKPLHEQLGCPVELVEATRHTELGECPQPLRDTPADAVILTGAALARAPGAAANVDFLRPRQPPPKRDPRKQKIAVAAAAALLGGFVIVGGGLWRLSSLDHQIAELRAQEIELNDTVRLGRSTLQGAQTIEDWDVRNIPQLDQLVHFEATLPGGAQRPFFSEYEFHPTTTTGETLATIKISGAAKTREDVNDFTQRLADEGRFRVKPSTFTTSRDDDYPHAFSTDADVTPKKSTPAAAVAKTK